MGGGVSRPFMEQRLQANQFFGSEGRLHFNEQYRQTFIGGYLRA